MGAGVHGTNGLNPIISRQIWERYNIPRSTHGFEVQIFPKLEMEKLQRHENQFMKKFQRLPPFSPNILSHILTGGRPVTSIIHKRMLSLLMNIPRKDGIELRLAKRQLAMKKSKSIMVHKSQ